MMNNNFIASVVEQNDEKGKSLLTNEAPTIIEKYNNPSYGDNNKHGDDEMTEFSEEYEFRPTLCLNDKQLPSAKGMEVGQKVIFTIEAEICSYDFHEDESGKTRQDYSFKLKKGFVKGIK